MEELTWQEAEEALNKGQEITHRYFEPDEYMEKGPHAGTYLLSGKHIITHTMFWHDRKGDHWKTGWSLVPRYKPQP